MALFVRKQSLSDQNEWTIKIAIYFRWGLRSVGQSFAIAIWAIAQMAIMRRHCAENYFPFVFKNKVLTHAQSVEFTTAQKQLCDTFRNYFGIIIIVAPNFSKYFNMLHLWYWKSSVNKNEWTCEKFMWQHVSRFSIWKCRMYSNGTITTAAYA